MTFPSLFATVNLFLLIIGVSKYVSLTHLASSALRSRGIVDAEQHFVLPNLIRRKNGGGEHGTDMMKDEDGQQLSDADVITEENDSDVIAEDPENTSETTFSAPPPTKPAKFCPKCRYKTTRHSCKAAANYLMEANNITKNAARELVYQQHPTHCRLQQFELKPKDLCFVTAEFATSPDDMDSLPILEPDMITDPSRHFVFTNQPSLAAPIGWSKVVLDVHSEPINQYQSSITQSRWPKFMGWNHPTLNRCQIIFYGDAYLLNPINETNWHNMAVDIKMNPVGLMQDKQIGLTGEDQPIQELEKVVREGKLSKELGEKTIQWLKSKTDYDPRAQVYKNAIFGYDPHNAMVQKLMAEFWSIYSTEELSWRDQPIWSYVLARMQMVPLRLHREDDRKLFGKFGEKGHGGHVYVPEEQQLEDMLDEEEVGEVGNIEDGEEMMMMEEDNMLNKTDFDEVTQESEQEQEEISKLLLEGADIEHEICFITSVFAESVKKADKIGNVSHLREQNPTFQYFAFTNLHDLPTPGWEKVVLDKLPYKRMITQSRLAKFCSWKIAAVRKCGVVFYSDGHLIPKSDNSARFRKEARRVKLSSNGLAQWKHRALRNYKSLTRSIITFRKDTRENVRKTMQQLVGRGDFNFDTTIYWNQVMAYDPNNVVYVGLSDTFWEMYSKEDGSWRDQLIWSYLLDSTGIKPRKLASRSYLYDIDDKARGFGNHIYVKRPKKKKKGKLSNTTTTVS